MRGPLGPLCYFCAGRMILMEAMEEECKESVIDDILEKGWISKDEVYICPDCEAVLYRGTPQLVINRNIAEELKAREVGMIKKKGGGGRSRQRKKKPAYRRREEII